MAVKLEAEIRVVGREKLGNLPINAWLAGAGRQVLLIHTSSM